jgi:hypothetical protein
LAYRSIIPCLPTLICSSFATSCLGRCVCSGLFYVGLFPR